MMKESARKLAAITAAAAISLTAAAPLAVSAAYGVGGNGKAIMEYLDRGIYAVKSGNGMFVSWRWNADDADDAEFRLYRDDTLIYTSKSGDATSYQDNGGNAKSKYRVDQVSGGKVVDSQTCKHSSGNNYFDIPLNSPGSQYSPNDCCVGDVDGDGQYEIFLKWDPSNSKDNSQSGKTDDVIIDCVTLEGKTLWRINLGKNIRAGQHYTQMCVADFDCDGKAELITKTADGTKDGKGKVIGDGSKDYRNGNGYILSGPEYMTLFDGQTGAALDTIDFPVPRGQVTKATWGDDYGNRVDRMNSGIAYLDGVHPSAIYGRGYYTRLTMSAVDVVNKKLVKRWVYDTGFNRSAPGFGCGNHNVMVADSDNDGKQEVFMGASAIDDNGKLLWTTGQMHGDAMHLGDLDPNHEGLELWECHEDKPYGESLIDAKNGKILFHVENSKDTGRCAADNIWSGNKGAEYWGAANGNVYNSAGKVIGSTRPAQNFFIYWDGDLEREILDGTNISKMTAANKIDRIFSAGGCASNNSSKSVPCMTADLFGDWREELIMRTSDNKALRVFCTTAQTKVRLTTLMHDMQYRAQNCCQQSSYNQPPHVSYYLGSDAPLPARPNVVVNGKGTGTTDPVIVDPVVTDAPQTPDPVAANGKYVRELSVLDTANEAGWFLSDQPAAKGSTVFGDRDYTYTAIPDQLAGAEVIESACGSKNTDAQLAQFKAGEKIDVFVLLDTRVETNDKVPVWLSDYQKTGMTAETSNDVTFSVYKKTFDKDAAVTLGTNNMTGNVVNYTVFVKAAGAEVPAETTTVPVTTTAIETTTTTTTTEAVVPQQTILRGDVNCDGLRDVRDAVLLSMLIVESPDAVVTQQGMLNADCNGDGRRTMDDTTLLLQFIAKLVKEL